VYIGQWKDDKKMGKGKFTYHKPIPFPTSKIVNIGPSETNPKIVNDYNPNMKAEPSQHNSQPASYGDKFKAKFDGTNLTVTRIDKNKGWGQNLTWKLTPAYNANDHGEYNGQWKDDKKEGKGTFTYPDDGVYIGQWKDDKKMGKGTFTYPDGGVFEGFWDNDKRTTIKMANFGNSL